MNFVPRTVLVAFLAVAVLSLLFLVSSETQTTSAQQPDYGESPDLAAQVAAGTLPPVEERLPAEPMVIPTLGDIGKYGGTLRRFYLGPADGCNFFRLSRASLVRFSQDGFDFIPSVAKDWDVNDDGTEWTFYLREGMKWSDGDDFTADDFVWQYENVILNQDLNSVTPVFLRIGTEVGRISKVDDTAVKFTFPVPNFLFLEIAAQADEACYGSSRNVPWAPSHYMKQFHIDFNPAADQLAKAAGFANWIQNYNYKTQYNLNPDKPTIAPWKLTNSLGDQVVMSERNPYFWAVDQEGNQLPYLDGIQLTLSEGGTEVGTLMTVQGDIDMQGRHIQLDQYTTLKQGEEQGDYTVLTWPTFGGSDVTFFFNMSLPGATGEAIRTKEFRQALSLAIDRSAIQENQFLGLGEMRQAVPPPGHPHYPGDDIAKLRTEYDPAAANALLDSVFPDTDREGWRLSNGERIVMSLTVTDSFGIWPDAAQMVGRAWEAVGVKSDVNQTTRTLHFTRWQTNQWSVMVWNEDSTGFTFSSIGKRAPEGAGTFHGPGCARWLIDPQHPHAFPCAQESLDLLEMHKRGPNLPEVERNALGKAIYRTIVENQYNIGIVGLSPMVQGVIVKKNSLNNVPDTAANDWPLRTPNTAFPEQWHFTSGKPPSRPTPTLPRPTATPTHSPIATPAPTATPIPPAVPDDVLNRLNAIESLLTTLQNLISALESKIAALDSRVAALEAEASVPTSTPVPTLTPLAPTPTPTPTITPLSPTPTPTPSPTPVADACIRTIEHGDILNGGWSSDCVSENTPSGPSNPPIGTRYSRFYAFTLSADSDVTIDLSSSEDTYLLLMEGEGRNGEVIAENDDIRSGLTNSRIEASLQPGSYTIEATTFSVRTTGYFQISLIIE